MTGAFLRVKRDGKWVNIEVEYLTNAERIELFIKRPPEELLRWLDLLCEYVAEAEKCLGRNIDD